MTKWTWNKDRTHAWSDNPYLSHYFVGCCCPFCTMVGKNKNTMTLSQFLNVLPLDDIEAAIKDPTDLRTVAQVVQDGVSIELPGPPGVALNMLISLYTYWVYASGGGTITADPNPEKDAQTTQSRGGRNG